MVYYIIFNYILLYYIVLLCLYIYICICTYVRTYVRTYVCMYVCIYVCIFYLLNLYFLFTNITIIKYIYIFLAPDFSPHLCVGFLFLILYPGCLPPPPASCHIPSFTYNFVHLCHTPSFTHNFVNHHLAQQLCHTPSFRRRLGTYGTGWTRLVTPVTPRHFAWALMVGTYGTGWRAWTGLVARDARNAATLCVAGVTQSHIHYCFARRGIYGTDSGKTRQPTDNAPRNATRTVSHFCTQYGFPRQYLFF